VPFISAHCSSVGYDSGNGIKSYIFLQKKIHISNPNFKGKQNKTLVLKALERMCFEFGACLPAASREFDLIMC